MSLKIGDLLDAKYEIKRLIGKGGMGNVYEGENVLIRRRVAIKVLNADVAGDASIVKRFEREAQAAGRIGSDHIVEVLDLGRLDSGERYMVMEFLVGESLHDRMDRQQQMAPQEIFPILLGLLEGLGDAHEAGILHRDLKPANVFLTEDRVHSDFVKIVDFGVSKFLDLSTEDSTATGVTLGTPRYMAPEQAKGEKDIDGRADLYSVGVILFRALTGRPPFIAETYNELMFKVRRPA
jgi:serine/threonine-protein kinase